MQVLLVWVATLSMISFSQFWGDLAFSDAPLVLDVMWPVDLCHCVLIPQWFVLIGWGWLCVLARMGAGCACLLASELPICCLPVTWWMRTGCFFADWPTGVRVQWCVTL